MTALVLLLNVGTIQAANVELSMGQAKHDQLKGWNVYELAYDKDNPPDGAFIMENYDRKLTWDAFSASNVLVPILEREWGCKVLPYPGYEDTYWEVTINVYIPGIDPALNQKVYFVVTSTGLNDTESEPSNVASTAIDWPGKPGIPKVSNTISLPDNTTKAAKTIELVPEIADGPLKRLKVQPVQ